MKSRGWLARVRDGLAKSADRLRSGIGEIVLAGPPDPEKLKTLETALIRADVGIRAAQELVDQFSRQRFEHNLDSSAITERLATLLATRLATAEKPLILQPDRAPHVILVSGVNGSGKTTSIGKLAARWRNEGHRVMIGACDTFRAAAIDQLMRWGERAGVPVITGPAASDPAAVAYRALDSARKSAADVLLIDTAGRLQTHTSLMDELEKLNRVMRKLDPTAPHDSLLVLDATVGQNALSQVEAFRESAGVTGLIMTKLDGSARGGILVALVERYHLPIHFIGVGESVDALDTFRAKEYAAALLAVSL